LPAVLCEVFEEAQDVFVQIDCGSHFLKLWKAVQ
jgi:hypothetical protein